MVKIPEGDLDFRIQGIEIEGFDDIGMDVQYPWEDTPRRFHDHPMHIKSFWIDKYPVTNAQFRKFLDATHYRPQDDLNFLRDWTNRTFPAGWENKPVTWVSLEDARAYASWAGKRLPHEWEWQYAAQGRDGRMYPWGNSWNSEALPTPDKGRTMRGPDAVDAHPQGASPFGVMDLVGNVWQWTSDWYRPDYYQTLPAQPGVVRNPQGPADSYDPSDPGVPKRVQKGGSFLCTDQYCTAYEVGARGKEAEDSGTNHMSFRCVLSPADVAAKPAGK